MPKGAKHTDVTADQAFSAVVSGQAIYLASCPIYEMRYRLRTTSEAKGRPIRGSVVDCTLTSVIVFLVFRSTEILLKAKVGMEGYQFAHVHSLTLPYDKLTRSEKRRIESTWRRRGMAMRSDATGLHRAYSFRDALQHIDTLGLNECLYWWTQEDFEIGLLDRLIGDEQDAGILLDVQLVLNDTAVLQSGVDYVETGYSEVLTPMLSAVGQEFINQVLVRATSGLMVPRNPTE